METRSVPPQQSIASALYEARQYLTPREHWCPGIGWEEGEATCAIGALAICKGWRIIHDTEAAILHIKGAGIDRAVELLAESVPAAGKQRVDPFWTVHEYNDRSTHGNVMAWLDRAIALALERGL